MRKNGVMTNEVDEPISPETSQQKKKFSWGWLIALIVLGLVVSGGLCTWAATNWIATSRYAARIDAGDIVGTLVIPRLGDTVIPIVTGTTMESLHQGVGWYEGTALPGEIGNFAVAGHRLGWGQPFAGLDTLEVTDEIRVTAQGKEYVYKIIIGPTVVSDTQNDVLAAVPGALDRPPSKPMITLTTAATWLPSPERLVVIGEVQPN